MFFLTQEELDALYDEPKREGKAICRISGESSWQHLNGEKGTVKWEEGRTTYLKNGAPKYIEGHYVFRPDNKRKHGNNVFKIKEEEIEWVRY